MCDEKVLVICGDAELCDQAADFLWEEGFKVESASDERDWHKRLETDEFDVVILDRALAGADETETVRRIEELAPGSRIFVAGARPFSNIMLVAENLARHSERTGNEPAYHESRPEAAGSF